MRQLILVISLLTAALLAFHCDGPTEPPPGPKEYVVFFQSVPPGASFFKYNVVSGKLDSVALEMTYAAYTPSADGRLMYFWKHGGNGGEIVNTQTWARVGTLPHDGDVAVSPDGRLIALQDSTLYILRPSDFSVVYHDTLRVNAGSFSPNSRRFYAFHATSDGVMLYRSQLTEPKTVSLRHLPAGGPDRKNPIRVAPNEDRLYFHRYCRMFMYGVEEYNIALDSIVFRQPLVPGGGIAAMTPDGNDLWYTDSPGALYLDGPPMEYAYAHYDARTGVIDSFPYMMTPCDTFHTIIDEFVITRTDGGWSGSRQV